MCFISNQPVRCVLRPVSQYSVFYVQSASTVCFTSSQPVRCVLRPVSQYSVFYVQSASTVCFTSSQPLRCVLRPVSQYSVFYVQSAITVCLRPVSQYGVFYVQSASTVCFTSSQPLRCVLRPVSQYSVFYVQSASTVCFTSSQPVRLYQSQRQYTTTGLLKPVSKRPWIWLATFGCCFFCSRSSNAELDFSNYDQTPVIWPLFKIIKPEGFDSESASTIMDLIYAKYQTLNNYMRCFIKTKH